ncbi:DUF4259 domain-containing protein [Corynebacterium liangguodongii]|uniref:Uncharacterized protein n=1 Tax=Corynebacterium liangguodongii TaxID=2079535 RepID=A0A2S0WDU1_9CORY|nr:DUF4259 domain-containing protein [Corynebacterium liangguodongii]AWB83931.1 hypothetical protein C3E79_05100 [Corynebacterium liangguodongii]PWB99070.1 DUF4259 domain-containing protein [Corynebacterium liangguodongii]
MGTWNWGPFDNDVAEDTVRRLADGSFRMDQFRFDCSDAHLDTEQVQALIALAAVMNGHGPAGSVPLAPRLSFEDRRWVEAKLREAMSPEGSELYGMWSDAGELHQWLEATAKAVH